MASVFTFEPGPSRVSSPWLTSDIVAYGQSPRQSGSLAATHPPRLLTDYNVTKLEPEPQTSSTEYKLHLLLRPRRIYSSSSTGTLIAGSQQSKRPSSNPGSPQVLPILLAPSSQSRQNRLLQLTTQLLWRLQQSSSYHASTSTDLVLPQLPEDSSSLDSPPRAIKLLPGLAESHGALYEIGVSDDGTFVGLTDDEMEESLTNLRSMATSLGCKVEVLKRVLVGHCEWQQETPQETDNHISEDKVGRQARFPHEKPKIICHQAQLWVVEALVTPHTTLRDGVRITDALSDSFTTLESVEANEQLDSATAPQPTEQLRITLTGPTTSGKSSLLGTLSTAALDNGRGKSRLNLLRHRHELASGLTSSVTQELLGYSVPPTPDMATIVINYAAENVSSWTDIHVAAGGGRLVFVSDSAGHPRFRRTTVRGLVGWAPHWTMLCIAADDGENAPSGAGGTSSAREILGVTGAGVDLAKAHLDLCLKLQKPLVIIITKLELASRLSLRQTLARILSAVKAASRFPAILPPDQSKNIIESDLTSIPQNDHKMVDKVIETMNLSDLNSVVPIIMTSAAKGTGVRMLHALLRSLPIPLTPTSNDFVGPALNPKQPSCIFHVEDVFSMPAAYTAGTSNSDSGVVVGGYLRFGDISIGDTVMVGPFPATTVVHMNDFGLDQYETRTLPIKDGVETFAADHSDGNAKFGSFAKSQPPALEISRIASSATVSAQVIGGEWQKARVVSIRNLRLAVRKLVSGQVGTLGIIIDTSDDGVSNGHLEARLPRVRKGMVLAIPRYHMIQVGYSLQAASGFTASFEDGDINSVTSGSLVVIYVASIRATARVVRLAPHPANIQMEQAPEIDDVFSLDDEKKKMENETPLFGTDGFIDVTLELLNTREWVELGSQVLIMPGGGHGLYSGTERGEKGVAGLEGYVGKVIEVVD